MWLSLAFLLALTGTRVAACGEKAAEKAVEKAVEEAAKEQGQNVDVDVDIDKGSGSVKVSGEQGEMQWQAGSNLDLPDGFPAPLLPKGAKPMTVQTSPGSRAVVFWTSDDPKKVFDYCLKAVTDLGRRNLWWCLHLLDNAHSGPVSWQAHELVGTRAGRHTVS